MSRRLSRACGILAAACALAACRPASACSVCIAHALSAALHGIGAQTLGQHRLIVGISYTAFSKSNAGDTPGDTEHEDFSEVSLDLSYGLSDRVTVRGYVPYVSKRVQMFHEPLPYNSQGIESFADPAQHSSGLGDAVLGVTYQLPPALKAKFLTAFSLDLKLPTGDNHMKTDTGALKEQHLQLGSGSIDVSPGVSVTWEGKHPGEIGYAGLRYRLNGTNNRAFRYGNTFFYNLGWMRPVNARTAFALEFNGRIANKDHQSNGTVDENSGGHLGYLSFSWRQDLGKDFGLIATYQQPVWKQLNGTQDEKPLFSISLSKMF